MKKFYEETLEQVIWTRDPQSLTEKELTYIVFFRLTSKIKISMIYTFFCLFDFSKFPLNQVQVFDREKL